MKASPPVRKIWKLAPQSSFLSQLVAELNVTPLQAQLLTNRRLTDVRTIKPFLHPRLSQIIDPMGMKG